MTATPEATEAKYTNRLIHETSPYLLQHAHNPVDWHPWGQEAFERARAENKPIFLSVGYAACHWCHVMERESFENEEIARLLNERFVSIKVDREERPDLDALYMQAIQLMSGTGGWPMSVFLTPEGKPFFGGTYFPPTGRHGRIGFKKLLLEIGRIWREQPGKVQESSEALTSAIAGSARQAAGEEMLTPELFATAIGQLRQRYDATDGGFGDAPKFPPPMALNLLLRQFKRTGDPALLEMVERTLRRMAQGGIYDQLGGGFHRYSTDQFWLVPHFEKMLYDNALLAPVYFDAALAGGEPFYEAIGREILDYVLREMTDPEGGFHSTQDADSEGVEGKYYVWRPAEIEEVLGPEDAAFFCEFYDVTPSGNWAESRGASILNARLTLDEFAAIRGLDAADVGLRLAQMRRRLYGVRSGRAAPLKDDKVLAAWNGLMISALARGAQATGDLRYSEAALRAAWFILERLSAPGSGLLRSWRRGEAKIGGFLEDYASLIVGLIDLYETVFEPELIHRADLLARALLERFYDRELGGFFTTDGRDATLVARIKEYYDGATPAGNSLAVHGLLRLGALLDRADYVEPARRAMRLLSDQMKAIPAAHHHLLCAVDFELSPPKEVAIIGKPDAPETQALLKALWREYLPNRLVALAAGDGSEGALVEIALLRNKSALSGRPTVYVCQNYACRQPVHTPEKMLELLKS